MNYNILLETINSQRLGYRFMLDWGNPTEDNKKQDKDKKPEDENPITPELIYREGGFYCPGKEWDRGTTMMIPRINKGLVLRLN